jgi:anti-sigma28 factor (negative regulator of flagellin synthesis)
MVTIQGLTGIPEPKSDRTSKVRGGKTESTSAASGTGSTSALAQDDVSISSEAQAASEINKLVQVGKSEADLRADKIAAAKERLERGEYKNPEVVAKVAERLMKYLS